MLTISKPTLFGPDGMAVRGQCNHDSPGWQLRWFDNAQPPVMIWQGAFKTCRHLQANCSHANTLDEAKTLVGEFLSADSFVHFASQPTDLYPTPGRGEEGHGGQHGNGKKKKKKRRH